MGLSNAKKRNTFLVSFDQSLKGRDFPEWSSNMDKTFQLVLQLETFRLSEGEGRKVQKNTWLFVFYHVNNKDTT